MGTSEKLKGQNQRMKNKLLRIAVMPAEQNVSPHADRWRKEKKVFAGEEKREQGGFPTKGQRKQTKKQ